MASIERPIINTKTNSHIDLIDYIDKIMLETEI